MNIDNTILEDTPVRTMTPDRIVRTALAAWKQGDFAEFVDQFNDKFKFTDQALGLEFTKKGRLTSAPINRSLTKSVRPRKRTVGRWIALIVVPGIVWGGVSYWRYSSQFEQTDDAYVTGHQHPVSFRVSGTISEVLVDDNS